MMKNKISILLILFINSIVTFGQTPDWIWAKNAVGNGFDVGRDITTDLGGNIYVTGVFSSDTIIFGNDTLINAGTNDIFITKYDSLGNVLWAKCAGGTSNDWGYRIAADIIGNIYVTGPFASSQIIFDNDTLIRNGGWDSYIAKYNSSGNLIWVKDIGGDGDDWCNDIIVDASSNIYITGSFKGSTLPLGSIILNNSITGSEDCFIAKLDSSGSAIWAKSTSGNFNESGTGITIDSYSNVYVTGRFMGLNMYFDTITLTNLGIYDIFCAKYDSSGNVLWAKSAGGSNEEFSNSITSDIFGNVYITGELYSSTMFFDSIFSLNNAGVCDIFIAKYDSVGNVVWAEREGGSHTDEGFSIIADSSNNLYLTGNFNSPTLIFGSTTLYTALYDTSNIYVAKFDNNGNVLWAKEAAGLDGDYSMNITIDANGYIYHTGGFISSGIGFDGCGLYNCNPGDGSLDMFVAKIDNGTTVGIDNQTINIENSIIIFPNPTNRNITLCVPPSARQIQILNSLGQTVQQTIVDRQTNFNFTLSNSGLYFIQVISDKQTVTKKLIVTK